MSHLLPSGKRLRDRYHIVKYLGGGGFGDTYLAEDQDLPGQPSCIVKHLRPKAAGPEVLPIARRLFNTEAQALYKLGNHDRIPRLFAHFEENGEFYLVQEFIDGNDLSQEVIPGHCLSEDIVLQLLQDILEVLAFVHQHQIVHRDIKPQNLMRRREDGKIVLIDFGAVKEIGALSVNDQGQTSMTVAIGSPGYMPNEQANGKPNLSSDVYAVGMLAIQALTGLMPHELTIAPKSGEILWHHEAQVSDRLAEVIDTMVRDHFSQRYQSAAAALQALTFTVTALPGPVPAITEVLPLTAIASPSPVASPTTSPVISPTAPKFLSWRATSVGGLGVVTVATAILVRLLPTPTPPITAKPVSPAQLLPQTTLAPTLAPATPVLLSQPTSLRGYTRLQSLLAAGNWQEADRETTRKMVEIAGKPNATLLSIEDINQFSCPDLHTIDQLWLKASNGRFGFSVQKRLWESFGGQPGVSNTVAYNKYAESTGWHQAGISIPVPSLPKHLAFAINAPPGHLPSVTDGELSTPVLMDEEGFLSRAEACHL